MASNIGNSLKTWFSVRFPLHPSSLSWNSIWLQPPETGLCELLNLSSLAILHSVGLYACFPGTLWL